MKKMLRLCADLALPLEYVTQTGAVIARKRRGKTYTASVMAEEFVKNGIPFVAIDPTGAWWGLRASADGKKAGLPVTIIGGEHGDVPLEKNAGNVIADLVVDFPGHYVLDTSEMNPEDMHLFGAEFGERLFKRKKAKRFPMHVFDDEADMTLPQVPENKAHLRCLRAFDKIIRQGGLFGLGFTMITQRPALVSKNALSQVEVLVVLQLIAAQDRDPVERWVRTHDTGERGAEFMKSLASLGLGEAWVWSPSWLNIFQRVQIRQRETFNSSKTPEVGDRVLAPAVLAAVDLEAIKAKVAATIEKVKAEDPKLLRARIYELEHQAREMAARKPYAVAVDKVVEKRVEVPVLTEPQIKRLETAMEKARLVQEASLAAMSTVVGVLDRFRVKPATSSPATFRPGASARKLETDWKRGLGALNLIAPAVRKAEAAHERGRPAAPFKPLTGSLGRGERVILIAVAQHRAQGGVSAEQLTVLTGYKRSSRNTFLGRLAAHGLVAWEDTITVTDAGVAMIGPDFQPLPTGAELRAYWLAKLGGGEKKILEVLVEAYPGAVGREDLTTATGYKRSSRNTFLQRLGARKLVLETGDDVRASDLLFEAAR